LTTVLDTQRENLSKVALSLKADLDSLKKDNKELGRRLAQLAVESARDTSVGNTANVIATNQLNGVLVSVASDLPEDQLIAQGETMVKSKPNTVFVGFVVGEKSTRVLCFVGEEARTAGYSAVDIVRKFAAGLRGSGGGTLIFAQGGGPLVDSGEIRRLIQDASSVVQSTKVK
jgi:alanyl-tRNA synthetase